MTYPDDIIRFMRGSGDGASARVVRDQRSNPITVRPVPSIPEAPNSDVPQTPPHKPSSSPCFSVYVSNGADADDGRCFSVSVTPPTCAQVTVNQPIKIKIPINVFDVPFVDEDGVKKRVVAVGDFLIATQLFAICNVAPESHPENIDSLKLIKFQITSFANNGIARIDGVEEVYHITSDTRGKYLHVWKLYSVGEAVPGGLDDVYTLKPISNGNSLVKRHSHVDLSVVREFVKGNTKRLVPTNDDDLFYESYLKYGLEVVWNYHRFYVPAEGYFSVSNGGMVYHPHDYVCSEEPPICSESEGDHTLKVITNSTEPVHGSSWKTKSLIRHDPPCQGEYTSRVYDSGAPSFYSNEFIFSADVIVRYPLPNSEISVLKAGDSTWTTHTIPTSVTSIAINGANQIAYIENSGTEIKFMPI